MQINHLPAVKTRCCSAMPFFVVFFYWFLFFLLLFFSFFFFLNFTALNIENPLKVSKLQPGVVLIGNNVFSIWSVSEICADVRACAHVYIKQT